MNKLNMNKIYRLFFSLLFCLLLLTAGCGTGPDSATPTPTPPTPTPTTVASLDLLAAPPTVKSDGTTSSTITVTALNASNAALSGIEITMSTDTGHLSPGPHITGDNGTATLTFSSGGGVNGPINRIATITATAGSVSSEIPIEVVGSTVTMTASGTSLTNAGTDSITLTITAKNAGGYGVNGAAVTLIQSSTNGGSVNFASSAGVTNASGVFETTVTGATAGAVTIIARALGAAATTAVTVDTVAETFFIDKILLNGEDIGNPNPTAMVFSDDSDDLTIRVNVPSASSSTVTFATSRGSWVGGTSSIIATPAGGKASATLNTASAGTATVQAYLTSEPATQDTLTVYMRSGYPADSIILQATPTVVPMNTGTSTITATVRDEFGNVVPNVPVLFSMVNPVGGSETILPVVALTNVDGQASTTFTAGTLPSYDAGGVKIRAAVIGTAVETGDPPDPPSGRDAGIVIGGVPGSIAFGQGTAVGADESGTNYVLPMSVLVTDINGNPVWGAIVSLHAWPIAWSTGAACAVDPDTATTGTFLNEDINENLILDADEDGRREYYYAPDTFAIGEAEKDTYITPVNSAGGAVPATVTTGINGVADFNLTYPKPSAISTITRIRGTLKVQGSETVGQTIFRLPASEDDDTETKCYLIWPDSHKF